MLQIFLGHMNASTNNLLDSSFFSYYNATQDE